MNHSRSRLPEETQMSPEEALWYKRVIVAGRGSLQGSSSLSIEARRRIEKAIAQERIQE